MKLEFDIEENEIGPFGQDCDLLYKGLKVGELFLNNNYSKAKIKKVIIEVRN